MFRLKRHDHAPPGGYPYEQTEGIRHKFKAHPDINDQARIVSDFRAGNGLPRATFAESLQDVDEYQCSPYRLNGNRKWCHTSDHSYVETTPKLKKKAGCCGAKVK